MVAHVLKNQKIPVSAQYQTLEVVEVLVDLVDSPVVVYTDSVTMEPYPDLVDCGDSLSHQPLVE